MGGMVTVPDNSRSARPGEELETMASVTTSSFQPSLNGHLTEALSARFAERFTRAESTREQHAGLEGHHPIMMPDAVVFAECTDDAVWLARWCNENHIPLIAHGAGTSLEGHLSAVHGGISLNLGRMKRILSVEPENLLCRIEAGVTREELNHHLRDMGLFFPIDPGANATLGGMAATRASGTNAVRYGTMRDNVLSLKVVLADGRVIETGTHARKSAAGYDLTGLFVGSEGTLGIVTELTLRLYGLPETVVSGVCGFQDLRGAVQCVILAIQLGLPLARIELLDERQIAACNAYSKLGLVECPTLFLEFHGSPASVDEQTALFAEIASQHGGTAMEVASCSEDRSVLWKARHDAYFATKALKPGARIWTSDVCVPIAHLAENILQVRSDIDAAGILATIVGHVGDGNFHVLFVLERDRPDQWPIVTAINDRMVARSIQCGGTCTGEHGIGLGKREKLALERGDDALAVMASIKAMLDPSGILNPGKMGASKGLC